MSTYLPTPHTTPHPLTPSTKLAVPNLQFRGIDPVFGWALTWEHAYQRQVTHFRHFVVKTMPHKVQKM